MSSSVDTTINIVKAHTTVGDTDHCYSEYSGTCAIQEASPGHRFENWCQVIWLGLQYGRLTKIRDSEGRSYFEEKMMYTLNERQAGGNVGYTVSESRNSRVRLGWEGEMDIWMWFPRRIK